MNQAAQLVLATGLTAGEAAPEPEEQDLVHRAVPRAEFERMLREDEIQDSISLAAWGLLLAKGLV
jgi:hypothetical protein